MNIKIATCILFIQWCFINSLHMKSWYYWLFSMICEKIFIYLRCCVKDAGIILCMIVFKLIDLKFGYQTEIKKSCRKKKSAVWFSTYKLTPSPTHRESAWESCDYEQVRAHSDVLVNGDIHMTRNYIICKMKFKLYRLAVLFVFMPYIYTEKCLVNNK